MKGLAGFFLACGLIIMAMAFAMAASAMQQSSEITVMDRSDASCLYCHEDAHVDWKLDTSLLPVRMFLTTSSTQTVSGQSDDSVQFCATCHITDEAIITANANDIDSVQMRLSVLHGHLASVMDAHPEWANAASRSDKSAEQITAEHIHALISFIDADGSWGIHDPGYTEEILNEAEALMADLLDATDV